jgi:hypothetical protein
VSAPNLYGVASLLTRDPDRHASVLGISLGGWHRIAYTDWGPLSDPTPVESACGE